MRSCCAPRRPGGHHGWVDDLALALSRHSDLPFPSEIEKGRDYGQVDPVMIDSDIYGWAQAAADGRLDKEGLHV